MTDIINDGDQSSASLFMQTLAAIQKQGQSVLADLETARTTTMFQFEQALSGLNAKRQRASRVLAPDIACRFVISDMLDIDQAATSATLRVDSQSGTCRERSSNTPASVRRTTFNCATGSTEQFNDLYRVHMVAAGIPQGIFELELYDSRSITLLILDMISMPSNPTIEVFGSNDGVLLVPAQQVSLNGYRINAWFPTQDIRYIQIKITPSMPDTLGGSTFTFGITDVSALTVDYYLYSEIVTKPVVFAPGASQVRFKTNDPGLTYFMQFDGGAVSKVDPDQIIDLPGVTLVSMDTHINTSWRLSTGAPGFEIAYALPADVYPSSIRILDVEQNKSVRVGYGLDTSLLGPALVNQWIAVHPYTDGGWMDLVPVYDPTYSDQSGRTFRVGCVNGPATMSAVLIVQLSTRDKGQTPVFRGAWLENVY